METFYRVHWADCLPFSAEHAWSALWGATRVTPDGSRIECIACGGTGTADGTKYGDPCAECDGDKVTDAERGYSCYTNPTDLIAYFAHRGEPSDDDSVIVFEGRQVGAGSDGETLAVPTRVIETMTWSELRKRENR
ncbi:hypothetical protein [Verrucosispora sp. TAA-831]|uniref:hypothetical protein n=1 Tax=Verrucosispora sp. TAA-831 TaxID=3422227 RepID=UPI003D6FD955